MAEAGRERRPLTEGVGVAERGARRGMPPIVVGAIAIAGLYFARPVLEPLALAALLSLMLAPAVRWLTARDRPGRGGLPDGAARSLLILGFVAAVGEEAVGLVKELPQYEQNIAAKIRSLSGGSRHSRPGHPGVPRSRPAPRCSAASSPRPRPRRARPPPVPVEIINTEPGVVPAVAQHPRTDAVAARMPAWC